MKAVVCTRYGGPEVLQVREVPVPVAGKDDVVIRIRATAATSSDCFIRSGVPHAALAKRIMFRLVIGIRAPRRPILGTVLAGEVESTGSHVNRFRVGDRVWAFPTFRFGCYAERTCLPATFGLLTPAPAHVPDTDAAAIPYGGLLGSYFVGRAHIQSGQDVIVYGASGSIGTSAVQLAKDRGARVTGVCSTTNRDLVRSIGADEVLDYTKDALPAGKRYDVVIDAVGRRKTSALKLACAKALTDEGTFVSVDSGTPRLRREDLLHLKQLVETGKLRPVIDRLYPLEEILDAHRYVEQGHKKGNVVITVD